MQISLWEIVKGAFFGSVILFLAAVFLITFAAFNLIQYLGGYIYDLFRGEKKDQMQRVRR